jgi:hypothetical protein
MSCISMNQNVFKLIEKADRDLADLVHNHLSALRWKASLGQLRSKPSRSGQEGGSF